MNRALSESVLLTQAAREDIQGLVTSGYPDLPCTTYLFGHFQNPGLARRWLQGIIPRVATVADWKPRSKHTAASLAAPPSPILQVALSFTGLRTLGLSEQSLGTFPPEFVEGMASAHRRRILSDDGLSAPETWEIGNPTQAAIHCLLILNTADRDGMLRLETMVLDGSHGAVSVVARETGERPPNDKEHFGFRDGIGQPDIEGIKGQGTKTGEFLLGYPNEYGYLPVTPLVSAGEDPAGVLVPSANPHRQGFHDFGLHGTFLVYRKLAQDVGAFWRFLAAESVRLTGSRSGRWMVELAAKMVGRWPNGAALTVSPDGSDPRLRDQDDFLFVVQDADGQRCPFGAHIRRTNPRDMIRPAGPTESLHMSARHRILRRGRRYGEPLFNLDLLDRPQDPALDQVFDSLPTTHGDRGLHFLCLNTSIKSQFEFIQQTWVNNPQFNGLTGSRDPLIGNGPPGQANCLFIPDDGVGRRTAPLPPFVTTRGGGYFFLPSLRALRFLARER